MHRQLTLYNAPGAAFLLLQLNAKRQPFVSSYHETFGAEHHLSGEWMKYVQACQHGK